MLVAAHHGLPIGQPLGFGIFAVEPETVAVSLAATPVGPADVVVKDDHDLGAGERDDYGVQDVEGALAAELRVGFHRVGSYPRIVLDGFVGAGQSHRVYADRFDLADDRLERSVIQTAGDKLFLIETVPVDRGQAHGVAGGVGVLAAAGGGGAPHSPV